MQRYREHPPDPALASHVRCYWTLRGRAEAPGTRRVVPDACQDLLFRFLGPGEGPPALAVGTMTEPLPVPEDGEADYLGVRFHPWGGRPFLGLPARELTDLRAPLDALWGPASGEVAVRLAALPPGRHRIRILARIHAEPALSLSRVALGAGYYDQAHLTREFGALAGEPPGAYWVRRGSGEAPGT